MPSIKVYKMDGTEAGTLKLSDKVFGAEYREELIHQAVVARLANDRQGTKSTLTRTEVRGGGRKPWRQKGTGNARQGSIRAPQWIKGGVVFAPKSRDFSKDMN
ncbi:MAG: 50S ribosomal protein L4, partial [Clostridia bacterium]|nr:50S ribosomal protein L4 [Clostridia bacterium]